MTARVLLFLYDVLICVRTLDPIASQVRHLSMLLGEADTAEERNYSF